MLTESIRFQITWLELLVCEYWALGTKLWSSVWGEKSMFLKTGSSLQHLLIIEIFMVTNDSFVLWLLNPDKLYVQKIFSQVAGSFFPLRVLRIEPELVYSR